MANWMIYGATGYTGQLVAEEAVARGHKPLLAGRSEHKLQPLAERLGLDYVAFSLTDPFTVIGALREAEVKLVYNAAGPFIHTSEPMLQACLETSTHYVDITGEIMVYQRAFDLSEQAKQRGIAIIPGVGFDVLPSDCLLKYVADQLPDATHLEVVVDTLGTSAGMTRVTASAGTMKSMFGLIPVTGNVKRVNGKLVQIDLGTGARNFRLPNGNRLAMPAPWGDVEMGYHTTGIPNITTYLTFPPQAVRLFRYTGFLFSQLLKIDLLNNLMQSQIDRYVQGPTEQQRENATSYILAQVRNAKGEMARAWLETKDAYTFTKLAAPRVVERVLNGDYSGTMTPAAAFGVDFVLGVPGTTRYDTLPQRGEV